MEKKKTSENNNIKKTDMEFGVRIATHSILKELNKDGGHHTNLLLSPLSLHICLNLIAAGAKGPTLDQLLRFLNAENVAQLNAQSSLFMELASPGPEPEPDTLNADETSSSGGTNQQLNDQPLRYDDSPFSNIPTRGPSSFATNPFATNSDSPFYGTPGRGPSPFATNPDWPYSGPPSRGPSPFAANPFAISSDLPFFVPPSGGPSPLASNPFATNSDSPFFGPPSRGPPPFAANPFAINSDSPFFGTPSGGKGPIISMVNGIWVDQRYSLKDSFKHMVDEIYRAHSQSVDFKKAEEVANEINDWAKEASRGHIDNLISSHSIRDSVLVLASATYFKASWLQRFNPSNTNDGDFYLLDGKHVRVPFMASHWKHYIYKPFDGFKLLKLEYEGGQDGKTCAMDIFLPDRYDGLQELIQKFHSDPRFFTQNHGHNYVELKTLLLPKLKFECGLDHLAENIKELGLDLPFRENAELTEIVDSKDNVYVSKAIQKSYIEVNEEGTVATSVNAFELSPGCALRVEPPPTIEFVADHPFLFVIKEELSGTVLFVGAVLNPLL